MRGALQAALLGIASPPSCLGKPLTTLLLARHLLPRSTCFESVILGLLFSPHAEATVWRFLRLCPASERCLVGGRGYAGSACSDPLAGSPVLATVAWLLSGFATS